jgi:hypothetical protein
MPAFSTGPFVSSWRFSAANSASAKPRSASAPRKRHSVVWPLADVVSVGRAVIEAKAAEATEGDRR